MKIKTILEEVGRLESMQEEAPHRVWTLLATRSKVFSLSGDQVSWIDADTDYGSVGQWRNAVEWLAEQFGGEVEWDDED